MFYCYCWIASHLLIIIASWLFDIANFVLIFIILLSNQLRSPNSFIYYVDKGESQKDNVNVVPNFSYKKTETHHGSCFISAIE